MFIIFEGPDGAGKTTMINKMKEQYPEAIVTAFGKPPENIDQFIWYSSALLAAKPEEVHILDRSWYSELVYGPIMRGKTAILPQHVLLLEMLVKQKGGGHVMHLTANNRTLAARCKKRGEDYVNMEQLKKIREAYFVMFKKHCNLPHFEVHTDGKA